MGEVSIDLSMQSPVPARCHLLRTKYLCIALLVIMVTAGIVPTVLPSISNLAPCLPHVRRDLTPLSSVYPFTSARVDYILERGPNPSRTALSWLDRALPFEVMQSDGSIGEVRVADFRSILTDFLVDFVAILDSILSSDGTKIVRKSNFTLITPFAMSILQRFSARLQPLILVEISYET